MDVFHRVILLLLLPFLARAGSEKLESLNVLRPEGARHVLVYAPAADAGSRPLVILLHGHGGSAAQVLGQERTAAPLSVWLAIARRENLIVVAPDGAKGGDGKQGWNDGREDARNNPRTDDVSFIAALIDREIAVDRADPKRIFVMGMSNGAIMTLRLAEDLGPRLAGVAAVCGSIPATTSVPRPNYPLSVMMIAGTADPLVPYQGGDVHFFHSSRGAVLAAEESVALWRKADHLDAVQARSTVFPHRMVDDPTRANRMVWGEDPKGIQVEFVRIDGGGHVEPSMTQRYHGLYAQVVGRQNADLETAEEAWEFFREKRASD